MKGSDGICTRIPLAPVVSEMKDYRTTIADELKRLEEDILYTEKAHFAAAEALQRIHWGVGIVSTVAAAATSVSVVADGPTWVSGGLALLATVLSALLTFVKPEERAAQHLTAARVLNDVRVQAREHREIDLHASTPDQPEAWRGYIDAIRVAKKDADGAAPAVSQRAFDKARAKIEGGDFEHVVDKD